MGETKAVGRRRGLSRDARIMLAASFFYLSSTMLSTPVISGFAGSLGATAAFMGIIGGLMNVCSLVMRPIAGNLSDIMCKRRIATIGSLVLGGSMILYAFATDPMQVAVLRLTSGAGYAFCSVCMSTWFASLLPPEHVGSGMGMFGMMNALGMAVGPAAALAISDAFGYRPALVFGGLMAVMTMVLVQFVSNPGEPVAVKQDQQGEPRAHRKLALVDKRVVPAGLIIALFTIPYMATQSFIESFVDARGIDVSVTLFFPAYALVLLAMRYLLKRQFDTVKFGPFLIASSISAIASMVLLTVMHGNVAMFAAAACMAGGYGIMCSVCQSTAVRLVGPEHAGMANSTYYMGLDIGMSVGPMIAGVLFGAVDLNFFYPLLAITVPLALAVYACSKGLRRM